MLLQINQDLPNSAIGNDLYLATVVDNDDPEQFGRIRIRISSLHGSGGEEDLRDGDGISDGDLPWAVQFRPVARGAAPDRSGYGVPRVGSTVVVMHHRGDIHSPLYLLEPYLGSHQIEDALPNYPNAYGFTDERGNSLQVNPERDDLRGDFTGEVSLELRDGNQPGNLELRNSGSSYVRAGGKLLLESNRDARLESEEGSVTLLAGGDLVAQADGDQLNRSRALRLETGDLSVETAGGDSADGDAELEAGRNITIRSGGTVTVQLGESGPLIRLEDNQVTVEQGSTARLLLRNGRIEATGLIVAAGGIQFGPMGPTILAQSGEHTLPLPRDTTVARPLGGPITLRSHTHITPRPPLPGGQPSGPPV